MSQSPSHRTSPKTFFGHCLQPLLLGWNQLRPGHNDVHGLDILFDRLSQGTEGFHHLPLGFALQFLLDFSVAQNRWTVKPGSLLFPSSKKADLLYLIDTKCPR